MNETLRIDTIKKLIFEQEKLVSERNTEKNDLLSKVEEIDVQNDCANKYINQLKDELEALGYLYTQNPISSSPNPELDDLALSQAGTFKILSKLDNPHGVQVKDIIREYEALGIITHSRLIGDHIHQLLKESKIFQINPENQRGRKYRVVK
jgi:hypothetical protein